MTEFVNNIKNWIYLKNEEKYLICSSNYNVYSLDMKSLDIKDLCNAASFVWIIMYISFFITLKTKFLCKQKLLDVLLSVKIK